MLKVKEYFGFASAAAFRKEWQLLSDEDKKQLTAGVTDETLSY